MKKLLIVLFFIGSLYSSYAAAWTALTLQNPTGQMTKPVLSSLAVIAGDGRVFSYKKSPIIVDYTYFYTCNYSGKNKLVDVDKMECVNGQTELMGNNATIVLDGHNFPVQTGKEVYFTDTKENKYTILMSFDGGQEGKSATQLTIKFKIVK